MLIAQSISQAQQAAQCLSSRFEYNTSHMIWKCYILLAWNWTPSPGPRTKPWYKSTKHEQWAYFLGWNVKKYVRMPAVRSVADDSQYSDATRALWHLKSPTTWNSSFKLKTKRAPNLYTPGSLLRECIGHRRIPHKGLMMWEYFQCHGSDHTHVSSVTGGLKVIALK